MKIHGQRWLYRVGNAEVIVDNAFSWIGWGQERWVINGETVRATAGWFVFRRTFDEPWLTPLGEGMLAAALRSQMTGIACVVTLDGEAQPCDALFEATWSGRGAWPESAAWTQVDSFAIFDAVTPRGRLRRRNSAD